MDMFTSLLYTDETAQTETAFALPFDDFVFCDLHIDQILGEITKGLDEYKLDEFYRQRPRRREDAEFRAAVARDIWDDEVRGEMVKYLTGFIKVRRYLNTGAAVHESPMKEKWKLDAAAEYVDTVAAMCGGIGKGIHSQGLGRFFAWLRAYAGSEAFTGLRDAARGVKALADGIAYTLKIDLDRNAVSIAGDTQTSDVCAELTRVFDRYDLRNVSPDIVAFADTNMNILERRAVAVLQAEYPGLQPALTGFYAGYEEFFHKKVSLFEREMWFYISYIEYAKRLEGKGYAFSLPRFTENHRLMINGGFDASLALARGGAARVVENDFEIRENEWSFLLTGPNQGGKTTFSRMLGQVLFFSALGLPIPCRDAEILWTNGLRTHFNVEENPGAGSGRLKEELGRLRRILDSAPDNSFVILNELFSSATTFDALEMGRRVFRLFEQKNCICLYITHLFELAAEGGAVSLIAETTRGASPVCTYKIKRGPCVRNAFADRLLAKRRLRREDIKEKTHAAFSAQPQ